MLVLFCHIYWNFPSKIDQWKSKIDVVNEYKPLYIQLIKKKLIHHVMEDKDALIEYVFIVLERMALDFIRHKILTFTASKFERIQNECVIKFSSQPTNADLHAIFSAVFKLHRPAEVSGEEMYSFHHKSIQENFAAKEVVRQLRHGFTPLADILSIPSK